ncbi:hypothetical protein PtrSN002B_002952 [Pyrenophora tritici-repentis]|uniref:Uncharacterized protein n=2 Tax=Pyrenophora tritici-repentis TaxID=45151 RepID=A0A2W1F6J6_9PLEO|nr:uncharacterized protein PTRG_05474 [Pyrenophora tritici-repentis Pt-1C-BFP]KAA8618536.1 hypothetical protein PtrV1_07965 [Pyrenophora tritici-repentis]EDU48394.1 predicted protein [Pyrenophora tritici-repentis Pt-1C-BFP]KAF7449009.1 hypothetical protein A1F99_060580 [Pyrenophora tritici-repentis]KAF7570998.1 hypothetical protein PtrM4_110000 [Pyrenophora tritici-repentis]KAG9384050.1 hypothetical protein A1F94_005961 [Pyrenophora tritici-repentis]
MVCNGPKYKPWNGRHREQAANEAEQWARQDRANAAYDRLYESYGCNIPAGYYLNMTGSHIKILKNGMRSHVTDDERIGPPGTIWVPTIPLGKDGEAFSWERHAEQYKDLDEYSSVMQVQVGFNELGYELDETGRTWRAFQLQKLTLGKQGDVLVYYVEPSTTHDRTREYYRQAADGTYTIVPPNPAPGSSV